MKYTRVTALAAVGIAATLSLTACDNDGPAQGTSAGASSSASSSTSQGGSNAQGGSGSGSTESGSTGSGSGGSSAGAATGSTGAGKVAFCKTQDLAIDASNASTGDAGRVNITMVNRGSTTCSATGFPGVDIKDADHTSSPVSRGHAQPRITTLKPGAAAVFDIAYTVDTNGQNRTDPTNIQVTPPNETHSVSLAWPSGAGRIKDDYTGVEVYPTHTN